MSQWPEQMSLEQLIDAALEQNYQIRVYRNDALAAQNSNTIGNAGMLPEVDITGELRQEIVNSEQVFLSGESQTADNATNNALSANIGATWIVFDGLAMFARKEQLEKLELLSRADQRFYIEQTVADLANSYYQLKQETGLLAAYRKSLEVSQSRYEYEKKALEVGASDALDFQLARVDRNTDSSLVLQQEAQIQEITIALNRIINRDLTAKIIPVDSIRLQSSFNLAELMARARENNAQLNRQQLSELIALSETKILRGALFPEVEVFGNYNFNRQTNEVGFLQSRRSFGPDFGVRVRFNLFSGGQERIASRNAAIALQNEELIYEDLNAEVEASLRVAYLRWTSGTKQVALEKESVAAAAQALEIASRQYELGSLTNVDFRIIQLNAINAETRFLEAQYIAKSREIELLRMSGGLVGGRM